MSRFRDLIINAVTHTANTLVPLTFTAQEANSTVALKRGKGAPTVSGLHYRTDPDAGWTPYSAGSVITLANVGDSVQFLNYETALSSNASAYAQFVMTGSIEASGSIQSMLNYSTSCSAYCYYRLFDGCNSMLTAPELTATTLTNSCYESMFENCYMLTVAPELPATTLTSYCYRRMFRGCTRLTTAPELPAITLAMSCYDNMFEGCTSLTVAPELPSTTLNNSCYGGMFEGCTSLTVAPELPATKLASSCYDSMFKGCTSLTIAPKLPASAVVSSCYAHMFESCTNLVSAELSATGYSGYSASSAYASMFQNCENLSSIKVQFSSWYTDQTLFFSSWVSGVAPSGTFYKPSSLPEEFGTSRIPSGWTVVNI